MSVTPKHLFNILRDFRLIKQLKDCLHLLALFCFDLLYDKYHNKS
ncbi:hypothetical protein U713_10090 [Rhodobacter capsulatus YW2]|nr:hypothetical protein U713_10090 [Rhodobacter capsulatus YW2]